MADANRGRVPLPPPPNGWTLRFDSRSAEEGWEACCSQYPGPTRKAFETIERDPFEHTERQHRLKGSDGTVRVAGQELEQWQYELTGSARILHAAECVGCDQQRRRYGACWTSVEPRQRSGMTLWNNKPWLTTAEVADEVGLSPDTVRRLIRERRLRATAIMSGHRVTLRIRRSDLDAFLRVHVKDTVTDDWE